MSPQREEMAARSAWAAETLATATEGFISSNDDLDWDVKQCWFAVKGALDQVVKISRNRE